MTRYQCTHVLLVYREKKKKREENTEKQKETEREREGEKNSFSSFFTSKKQTIINNNKLLTEPDDRIASRYVLPFVEGDLKEELGAVSREKKKDRKRQQRRRKKFSPKDSSFNEGSTISRGLYERPFFPSLSSPISISWLGEISETKLSSMTFQSTRFSLR